MIPLIGYDNNGQVFDAGDFIIRKIKSEYINKAVEIFQIYRDNKLHNYGIVKSQHDEITNYLIHEKHVISYPHEWTANMFKEAVLFHIGLFKELDKFGLTLKDAVPLNILFDYCKPVFIDFLSLVKKENLKDESWLTSGECSQDPRLIVIIKMLIPFLLIPFVVLYAKKYNEFRNILFNKACNSSLGGTDWSDLAFINNAPLKIKIKRKVKAVKKCLSRDEIISSMDDAIIRLKKIKNIASKKGDDHAFELLLNEIYMLINNCDVTPVSSAYASYYEEKNEIFNFTDKNTWKNKQINVYRVLENQRPKQVLDIGSNTGWFSRLAETLGARVIAIDVDESSIDRLYLYSRENNLRILPLLMSFQDFNKELYGLIDEDPVYAGRDFVNNPMLRPATQRLKSDLVLCLGLLHHLILGMGDSFCNVFSVLGELTQKTLIIEFIDLSDPLIRNEPSYFKNLSSYNKNNYNMEIAIAEGLKKFSSINITDSHPETRKLLIFQK